jgi:hypothetical protein
MLCLAKRASSKQARIQSPTPPVFSIGKGIWMTACLSHGTKALITTLSTAA